MCVAPRRVTSRRVAICARWNFFSFATVLFITQHLANSRPHALRVYTVRVQSTSGDALPVLSFAKNTSLQISDLSLQPYFIPDVFLSLFFYSLECLDFVLQMYTHLRSRAQVKSSRTLPGVIRKKYNHLWKNRERKREREIIVIGFA